MGNYNASFSYNAPIIYDWRHSVVITMRRIPDSAFTRLADTQYEAMNDLCNIYHKSLSSGTYGTHVTETLTGTFNIQCGFEFTNGKIVERGQAVFVDYDVILRLPATQPINMNDVVVLVEKGNIALSGSFAFEPYSQPTVSSSVQHVQLKRVA